MNISAPRIARALSLGLLFPPLAGFAAEANLLDMSIDDLAKVEIKIASVTAKPIQAQPAVVSVVTAKDIQESGAHDLKDILQQIPGFSFGLDVYSQVGPGFRGLWAYEGKIQLQVDGIEMNDGIYGNLFPLDHYAATNIKQVDLIRGPGSASYGGTAELAVISITTKGAEQNGGSISDRLVIQPGQIGNFAAGNFGYQVDKDWRISASFSFGDTARTTGTFVGLDGTELPLKSVSSEHPMELNFGVGWKGLDLRVYYDRYHVQDPTFSGYAPFPVAPNTFANDILAGMARYELQASETVTVTPKVTYKTEKPWNLTGKGNNFLLEYNRLDLDLPVTVRFTDASSAVAGVRLYREYAKSIDTSALEGGSDALTHFDGSDHVRYNDWAAYTQYDLDTKWVNVTLGGRYEHHDYSGGSFVPRVGLVKAWDKFHVKALFNEAFRTPNVEVIQERMDPGKKVLNESTTGYELEAGYQASGNLSWVSNLYLMRIKNLIGWSGTGYDNGAPMSTVGFESQVRYVTAAVTATAGYAYSRAREQGVDYYSAAPTLSHANLGMPSHQFMLSATWHLRKTLDWNFSGTYLGRRGAYFYPYVDAPGILKPEALLNTYLEYRWGNYSLGVGVRNLFNETEWIAQSYNGGSGALPLAGRSCFVQAGSKF